MRNRHFHAGFKYLTETAHQQRGEKLGWQAVPKVGELTR
jgi:hypothetical protein